MKSRNSHWRWIFITALAPVAWGSNYFVTRQFLPVDLPLWGAVIRALPAGLLLLAFARELPRGHWWWRSLVLGALNVGAFFALIYLASVLLPSSVAATLMATSAAVLLLLAWPLLGERPTLLAIGGTVLGFAGVLVMFAGPGGSINPLGVVASLAAMLLSSIGYILTKRWGRDVSVVALTSWQLLAGGVLLVPAALLVEGVLPLPDPPAIAAYAYTTLVATALANLAWFWGLRHLPASTVGVVGLLNPVTGVALGTLVAGEIFGLPEAIGTALILVGVFLGRGTSRKPRGTESARFAQLPAAENTVPVAAGRPGA